LRFIPSTGVGAYVTFFINEVALDRFLSQVVWYGSRFGCLFCGWGNRTVFMLQGQILFLQFDNQIIDIAR